MVGNSIGMRSNRKQSYQSSQKYGRVLRGVRTPSVPTSWNHVGDWYNTLVGSKGQYYHTHVVLPGVLRLLQLQSDDRLLDLGCGQGVLSRRIPKTVQYVGIDAAPSLITSAKKYDPNPLHEYFIADVTKILPVQRVFSHVAIILALQNIEHPEQVLNAMMPCVTHGTQVVVVLNHPCFRIPRQSSWGIDEAQKLQYRRINRYISYQKIPITMHPGTSSSAITWSFHHPLSYYITLFTTRNFMLTSMEEWVSDKESVGGAARMENRARSEFPLFLALKYIRK